MLCAQVLDFVVKADTQGAAEALAQAVQALEAEDDKLQVRGPCGGRVLRPGSAACCCMPPQLQEVLHARFVC